MLKKSNDRNAKIGLYNIGVIITSDKEFIY